MADQKKWFKVWGSILVDPSLSGLSLADMGRWVRLGAYLTTCGERGKLTITNPAPMFLLAMEVESLADAKIALKRLPNVSLEDTKDDNGSFIVTMKNWYKYQIDSTVVDRMKTLRSKRRVEEKREEERGGEQKSLHPRPPLSLWREKVGKLQDWERRERQGDLIGELESFHLPFEMQDQLIKEYFVEDENGNDAVRGKSIDQQAAERFRTQGTSGLRKASESQPILDRIRNLPKVPPEPETVTMDDSDEMTRLYWTWRKREDDKLDKLPLGENLYETDDGERDNWLAFSNEHFGKMERV